MRHRIAAWLALGLALSPALAAPSAVAQGGSPAEPPAQSEVGKDYASRCWRNGIRCSLVYGETDKADEPRPDFRPTTPMVSGPWAVAAVIVALVLALVLWMRFAGGGILLSRRPRELRKPHEDAPDSWKAALIDGEERPDQFLGRIAAMADRRQAMIQLLRRCLLHAAEITETRLFRYDTERAVLARLPADMPGRSRLEDLLAETELVHYGNRTLAEPRFHALIDAARSLLTYARAAHA